LSNSTTPKTKRERIRELILASSPTKYIVDQVHTSKEYVYKERGKLKAEGLLVEHRSLTLSDGQKDIVVVRDQPKIERYTDGESISIDPVNSPIQDYDIPPLDTKGAMLMYNAFENGTSPAHVTAQYGIHPSTSQKEYNRYLAMNSRDPFDLQNKIVSGISNAPPEIQSIIDKSGGNLLTNDEILKLIDFKNRNNAHNHIGKAVLNVDVDLPDRIERPKCKQCNAIHHGVIYDRNTYVGSFAQKMLDNMFCHNCKLIIDEIYAQFNQNTQTRSF